jgi:hypothetical protein
MLGLKHLLSPPPSSNVSSDSDNEDSNLVDVSAYFKQQFLKDDCNSSDDERNTQVKKRRLRRRLVASTLLACTSLMQAYVRYRGGLQQLRNYEVPEKSIRLGPNAFCDKMFRSWFRFERFEVHAIIQRLDLPNVVVSSERDRAPIFEVFCMMCAKYAFPKRFCDLLREFCRSTSAMSRLISTLRKLLYSRFAQRLRHPPPLSQEQCACFASKCRAVCGHPVVVGFIDGTVREICRPTKLQGPLYNGKDRIHSLKYQAINTPDGTIRHLGGPYPGSRHDQFMLRDSGILDWIAQFPKQQGSDWPHVIYADLGYSIVPGCIEVPYHDEAINVVHAAYNNAMSSARISVEWAFGGILMHWASLRYVPHQQLLSNRKIGQIYFVAALLTNLLNCIRPNETAQYFNCTPPTLDDYLSWLMSKS